MTRTSIWTTPEDIPTYYICNIDGTILTTVENGYYDFAVQCRNAVAKCCGEIPEFLDILTPEEYQEEFGDEYPDADEDGEGV